MKKTFRIIGMALIAMIVSITFNACSSDDNDEPADPSTHDAALVGTWTKYDEGRDWWYQTEITFKSNGTFRVDETYYDEEDGKEKFWATGEWHTENSTLYTVTKKSNEPDEVGEIISGSYYVSDNILTFDGVVYTKK